ncbi:MAG: diguanylate cyclase domain-containing protein [bacterium]
MKDWVMVVDSDEVDLKFAEEALKGADINVTPLTTNRALLNHLRADPDLSPDLVLLEMPTRRRDVIEIMKAIRRLSEGHREIPVIFLSADQQEEAEARGLRLGALDFIRKPLKPDILVSRVQKALRTQEKLQKLERDVMIDRMTGFLNKDTVEEQMRKLCQTEVGFLCVLDLDSFKLVNDLYGHDMGDRTLILFSNLLKNNMRGEDVCGRIGGDEFVLFAKHMRTESELRAFTDRINRGYLEMMRNLLGGAQLKLPLGVSIGAAAVPTQGQDYSRLFHLADQALSTVKQSGKHSCALNGTAQKNMASQSGSLNLEAVTMILEERNISSNAMWMGREAFINIYRYMMRYMERYHGVAYRVLFSIQPKPETDPELYPRILERFRQIVQDSLRNSDVMVEVSDTQIFLLLPETHDNGIEVVTGRLMRKWEQCEYRDAAEITWEAAPVHLNPRDNRKPEKKRTYSIAALGHIDQIPLTFADDVLWRDLDTSEALFEHFRDSHPDVLLLDADSLGEGALNVLRRLRGMGRDLPTILITSDATRALEVPALQLGAVDCARRPFEPEALAHRVQRALEHSQLSQNMAQEVQNRTEAQRGRFMHIIATLTNAIDGRDASAAGHSERVAGIARELGRRCGYSESRLSELYMMALLHDVGNLRVPAELLNKPSALTEAEFDAIRSHTTAGAKLLETLNELPTLTIGARWHHERYDGRGYPDGLSGEAIPEEARIIAVAEAVDAMSSPRAYRPPLSMDAIRRELEHGAGTQFDPRFVRIMLEML